MKRLEVCLERIINGLFFVSRGLRVEDVMMKGVQRKHFDI